jgi:4-amino-4-deoxychorismate lyase
MMAIKTLINGQPTDEISCLDRGLQYGDGLFETIAVDNGELLCWEEHLERLQQGCNKLKISFPDSSILKDEVSSLINSISNGVIKIIVTRGQGGRGYALPDLSETSRLVSLYSWPEYPNENSTNGISVRVCEYRYAKNPVLAGIKHLNRLEQVLARSEWNDDSFAEGIVLDQEDNVIEGTMSNIFYLSNNVFYTPDLTECGVNGVIRNKIIALASNLGINIEIKKTSLDSLMNADEGFMCNSIIGIWPINKIDGKIFSVGEKTHQMKSALQERHYISTSC